MIGLGRTGANLVRRLMCDGHPCVAYDRNPDVVKSLKAEGADVPASHAGIASAVNNNVARGASLTAVAVLATLPDSPGTAYLHPAHARIGRASLISASLGLAGGVLAAVTIRDPRPEGRPAQQQLLHCALNDRLPAGPHR
jgi:hypothetical protein